MERNIEQTLDSNENRQFIFKLLNEDQDQLALKLAEFDDVLKIYLYEPINQSYIEVEYDTESRLLKTNDNHSLVLEKYLNDKYKLLYVDLQSNQMYKKITDGVQELSSKHGITYEYDSYKNLLKTFDNNLKNYPTADNIKYLYSELQKTENAITKMDEILKDIHDYQKIYNNYQEPLNLSTINYSFEQVSKVSVYNDSWSEMKSQYERQADFLKVSLKHETEKFLQEYTVALKNVRLDQNFTGLAQEISKHNPQDLKLQHMIPYVAEGNINSTTERLRSLVDNHLVSTHIQYSLQRIALSDPSVEFEGSKLSAYIETLKKDSFENTIDLVKQEFKGIYGDKFSENLFTEKELNEPSRLFEKIMPIIEGDTLSPYELHQVETFNPFELHQFEPLNKRDYEVLNFWESKSVELLEITLSKLEHGRGMIQDFREHFVSYKQMEQTINRMDELSFNNDDLSKKMIRGTRDMLETSKDTISALRTEIRMNLVSNKERISQNQNYNSLLLLNKAEANIDTITSYIDKVNQEKTNETQKDIELER